MIFFLKKTLRCGQDFLNPTAVLGPSPSLALKNSCKTLWPAWKEAPGKMDAGSNGRSRFRHEVRDNFHIVVKKEDKGQDAWEVVTEGPKCAKSSQGQWRTQRGGGNNGWD